MPSLSQCLCVFFSKALVAFSSRHWKPSNAFCL